MPYPERLIPKETDRYLESLNQDHILCRGVDDHIELRDSDGNLSPMAIDLPRIPGFSINKVPPAKPEDICYMVLSKEISNKSWIDGDPGRAIEEGEYVKVNRLYFLIKVGDIHGYVEQFPFPADNSNYDFEFQVSVVHAPLVSNYSHCEFSFLYFNGNEKLNKTSKGSQKKINHIIRERIIDKAKFDITEF